MVDVVRRELRAGPGGERRPAARRRGGAIRVDGLAGVRGRASPTAARVPRWNGPRLLLRPGGLPGAGRASGVAGLADAGHRRPHRDPGAGGRPGRRRTSSSSPAGSSTCSTCRSPRARPRSRQLDGGRVRRRARSPRTAGPGAVLRGRPAAPPADEDEWWSCHLDSEPETIDEMPGLRWHCRDSYVLAPPSRSRAGRRARWLRAAAGASAAGRAAAARVPRRRLRGVALPVTQIVAYDRAVRPRARGDPGRGELPGARVRRGRRHAPVHGPRVRALPDRRRRPRLRRPGLLVGADDPRARAPGRGRPRCRRRWRDGTSFGTATPGEVELAEEIVARAPGGAGPAGQLGHRGDDVGDPAGPRLHRPPEGRQVRRLLPRARRRAARRGGLRRGDLRAARLARRDRRGGRRHHRAAVQRPGRRVRRRSPSRGDVDRLRDHRGVPGQHGRRRRPRPGSTQLLAVAVHRARRAADHGRGDDRVPGHRLRLVRPRRRGRAT